MIAMAGMTNAPINVKPAGRGGGEAGHGVGIDIVQNLAVKFPAFWLLRTEEGMPSYMCRVTLTEKTL